MYKLIIKSMDKIKDKCGIYTIKCLNTNKLYIGSSKNIYKRWSSHRGELRRTVHFNSSLQKSWNKYGEEAFEFKLIKECKPENRYLIEEFLIKKYRTWDRRIGFNTELPGIRGGLLSMTDITKEKLRKITYNYLVKKGDIKLEYKQWKTAIFKLKDKYKTGRENRKLLCFDTKGNFIREYSSTLEAAKAVKGRMEGVRRNAKNKQYQKTKVTQNLAYKGFVFIYKKDYIPGMEIRKRKSRSTSIENN